jgi:uncharacterized protein (TIGR00661 family)
MMHVLVGVLNWGLGHATRCMPMIDALLARGAQVTLASDGAALYLLRERYPQLPWLELPGYGIRYPQNPRFMLWEMLKQLPNIWSVARQENQLVQKWCAQNKPTLILSDNRFGVWSKETHSVYLTHQLEVRPPEGLRSLDFLGKWVQKPTLQHFQEVWVPDFAGGLAGRLAHGWRPRQTRNIGLLSRFKKTDVTESYRSDLLIVLSGPEPHRTLLEEKILVQVSALIQGGLKVILVRGKPQSPALDPITGLEVYEHLAADELGAYIMGAQLVLCRSGYSTLMDLCRLGKKAVLVPTPGQTEQIYLAQRCAAMGWAPWVEQDKLQLSHLPDSFAFKGFADLEPEQQLLDEALNSLPWRIDGHE